MDVNTIIILVLIVVALGASITFHEFMHAYASNWLGDDTAKLQGRLTLNPVAHIDPFLTILMPIFFFFVAGFPIGAAKPVQFNPYRLRYGEYGAAIVAAAGPLTNFLLAVFFALWVRLLPLPGLINDFFILNVLVNLGFFVFNMIPFPPLDGSRVLYALAPDSVRGVMKQIESFGIFGIVLFILVLYRFISPVIGAIIQALLSLLLPDFALGTL